MIPTFDTGSLHDEEGRAFQQNRVAFFGKVGALFFLAVACSRAAVLLGRPQAEEWGLRFGGRAFFGAAVALGAVWLACRSGRRSAGALRWIDAAACCWRGRRSAPSGSSGSTSSTWPTRGHQRRPDPHRPGRDRAELGVPDHRPECRGERAGPRHDGHQRRPLRLPAGLEAPGAVDIMIQVGWLGAAIALAALASRVTYGLRAEVHEARQGGPIHPRGEDRRRRHGRGLPGPPRTAQAADRGEAAIAREGRAPDGRALRARGADHGAPHPPNTVAIYDYGRTLDGVFYYAMEYLEGISLEKLVTEDGPQAPGRVVEILRQVAGALGEAHALGLVHRDIKPANVILCERGGAPHVAKVLDFGLVKDQALPEAAALTQSGMILGTPSTWPPRP